MGPILVYTALLLVCGGALFRPAIGAIGYIGFSAFTPHWLWRFQLDTTFPFQKWVAASLLLGWCFSYCRTKNLGKNSLIPLACLTATLALGFLSAANSYAPDKSEHFLNYFSKIVLITCVITLVLSSQKTLLLGLSVMAVGITFNSFEINGDYYSRGFSRVNQDGWAYQNANGYAMVMQTGALICFALAQQVKTKILTVAWLIAAVVNVHAIMIVESRGAMLGLISAGILHLAFMRRTSKNIALTFFIALMVLLVAGPPVIKEFSSIFSENLDYSGASRFHLWDAGVRITLDYPLLGVGPWAGEVLMPAYYQGSGKTDWPIIALHNLELEVSTGLGIPATVMYLLFFFLPWNQARALLWKKRNATTDDESAVIYGAFLAIPAYWVASQFNSGALIEVPYLLVAILIAALMQTERAERFRDNQMIKTKH